MTDPAHAATASVFVVDDEPDVRLLARTFLKKGGFDVVGEAEDGPQGLAGFLELDPPRVPSVVLLDNRMPGLTGLEVAEQILAQHPSQVIVLFSAHLDDAVKEEAHALGITACVSKMETSRLPQILKTLLQQA